MFNCMPCDYPSSSQAAGAQFWKTLKAAIRRKLRIDRVVRGVSVSLSSYKGGMSVVISSLVWYCPTDRNQFQQREMSVISSSTPNPGFNKWHVGGDAVYYFWKGWRKRKSRHNITEISRPLLNGWATCHLETIWELKNLSVLWHPSSLPISPSYQSNLRSLHQRPFSF